MTFSPDGKMTREPTARAGYKNNGTWKLDAKGFCTSWQKAKATCYTVIPNGDNKWSVKQGGAVISDIDPASTLNRAINPSTWDRIS